MGSEEEEEEEDEEEDDEDEEEEEEHEECAVLLLCGFSESLLSDRSEVMSVFSLFRPAFFSSSSPFLRLFTACLAFGLESGQMKKESHFWILIHRFDYLFQSLCLTTSDLYNSATCDLLLVAVKET